jgi:Uma2 family endonuclease
MQPDVLVGRDEDFTDKEFPMAPLLAVEVLSPSTRADVIGGAEFVTTLPFAFAVRPADLVRPRA